MARYDWWSFVGSTAVTGSKRSQLSQDWCHAQRWERRLTSDEVRPQFAFSKVIGSDVTVNRTSHYVRWTDVNGLD